MRGREWSASLLLGCARDGLVPSLNSESTLEHLNEPKEGCSIPLFSRNVRCPRTRPVAFLSHPHRTLSLSIALSFFSPLSLLLLMDVSHQRSKDACLHMTAQTCQLINCSVHWDVPATEMGSRERTRQGDKQPKTNVHGAMMGTSWVPLL